ncbi:hypothetical protein DUI87_33141 [Hirundo rustica rustica]|uniref:RNA-binding protein 4 n=2 Tax=Neoaves TaxID=3078114 RepID=A0A3M0IRR3_HIRRU|nr:hypothetical protein DUI87_33141 [Hirundo rustica rustica]
MVKLFIGNLPREATEQEIRSLFEQYGKVLECDIIKNYGFVHIEDKTAAEDAIRNLHHHKLHGVCINVEASKNKSKASTKLHFEEYGPVIECDIVKDYAFVHMERAEDAVEAIRGLDNTEFQGKRMRVQLSTSRLRTAPGMGDKSGCYRCGKEGHWSKECPVDRPGQVADFAEAYNEQYGAVRTPYTAGYGETVYYDEAYGGMADYYKRYRVRSYATASAYDAYAEQTMAQYSQYAQYSQVQSSATMAAPRPWPAASPPPRRVRPSERCCPPGARRPPSPPPPPTAAAAAASSTYYTRDRSPLRRTAAAASTVGERDTYERGQLSPVSSVARASSTTCSASSGIPTGSGRDTPPFEAGRDGEAVHREPAAGGDGAGIRSLFEQYGKVLECDIIKNYGFVHIEDKTAAEDAIRNLHHHKLHGVASTPTCTNLELRAKLEYGPVIECDIVKDYAFVHMERAEDAVEAIRGLDNTESKASGCACSCPPAGCGRRPGWETRAAATRCGKEGHWSKECPVDRPGQVADFAEAYNEQYGAVRTPYTAGYGETVYYDEAYAGWPTTTSATVSAHPRPTASAYDAYAEQTMAQYFQYAQYSQVQSSAMAATTAMAGRIPTTLDAYDRALLPTPGAAPRRRRRRPPLRPPPRPPR